MTNSLFEFRPSMGDESLAGGEEVGLDTSRADWRDRDPDRLRRSPSQDARMSLQARAKALYEAGATKDQAYFMALEEAWKDEVAENARLWDQAHEIAVVVKERERLVAILDTYAKAMDTAHHWLADAIDEASEGDEDEMIREERGTVLLRTVCARDALADALKTGLSDD